MSTRRHLLVGSLTAAVLLTAIAIECCLLPAVAPDPTFRLSYQEAQVLMDDLWASGLRPTEGNGSAGALAATNNHLQDMRRLVFDGKGVKP